MTPFWIGLGILGLVTFAGILIAVLISGNKKANAPIATQEKGLISDDELAEVPVSEEGQFPNSVTVPPAWLIAEAPFDVVAYFKSPAAEENAARLYLDAMYEFEPELAPCFPSQPNRKPIAAERSERIKQFYTRWDKNPKSVNKSERDQLLEDCELGLQKLMAAQRRPKCQFQTGITLNALVAHGEACRAIARVAAIQAEQALEQGNLDQAMDMVQLTCRLSRDMCPRNGYICQLVSVAVEAVGFQKVVDPILADTRLTSNHCRRLLDLLETQSRVRIDQFLEGNRTEYVMHRIALYDLEHRTGDFPPNRSAGEVLNLFSGFKMNASQIDVGLSRMTPRHFVNEVTFVQETQRLIEQSHDQTYARRQPIWKKREQQMKNERLLIVTMLSSPIAIFDEATTRGNARLNGYRCLAALKLCQLENGSYPQDLASATKAAGLNEVPADPYRDNGKLQMAMVNSRPLVYSVASDLKDDRGLRDWKFGQQPGDFLFPMPGP